jgi:hypothetical protein
MKFRMTSFLLALTLLLCLLTGCSSTDTEGGSSNASGATSTSQGDDSTSPTDSSAPAQTPTDDSSTSQEDDSASPTDSSAPAQTPTDGQISATIILVLEDETQVEYPITVTKDSTLRDALYEAQLISDDDYYDLFVQNIDGHVANVYEDGCTWLPQDTEGNQIMGSFDEIIVEDNETIYLVYYLVPDMD